MNKIISKPRSIAELAFCFAGPTLWMMQLAVLYCSHALFCARGTSFAGAETWFSLTAIVSTIAVLGLAVIFLLQAGDGLFGRRRSPFLRDLGLVLSGLSAIGIVWGTLPAILILPCR